MIIVRRVERGRCGGGIVAWLVAFVSILWVPRRRPALVAPERRATRLLVEAPGDLVDDRLVVLTAELRRVEHDRVGGGALDEHEVGHVSVELLAVLVARHDEFELQGDLHACRCREAGLDLLDGELHDAVSPVCPDAVPARVSCVLLRARRVVREGTEYLRGATLSEH